MDLSDSPTTSDGEPLDFARNFGRRVRGLRRTEGFRSARELAEEISNPVVSESVVRNIESGRKADVSLVHVLEISQALDLSPIALLFDYRRPFQPVPPLGFGALFAGKCSSDLDIWFSQPDNPLRFESGGYRDSPLEVQRLLVARRVDHCLRVREQLDTQRGWSGVIGNGISDERPTFQREAARKSTQVMLESALSDAHELGLDLTGGAPSPSPPDGLLARMALDDTTTEFQ